MFGSRGCSKERWVARGPADGLPLSPGIGRHVDQPRDGLNANAAVGFKALLETLAREGKTIVYSSHVLDVVERVCHRVAIIVEGRLLVDGTPKELLQQRGAPTLDGLFTGLSGVEARVADFARNLLP